jgi:hypothetical protein
MSNETIDKFELYAAILLGLAAIATAFSRFSGRPLGRQNGRGLWPFK